MTHGITYGTRELLILTVPQSSIYSVPELSFVDTECDENLQELRWVREPGVGGARL